MLFILPFCTSPDVLYILFILDRFSINEIVFMFHFSMNITWLFQLFYLIKLSTLKKREKKVDPFLICFFIIIIWLVNVMTFLIWNHDKKCFWTQTPKYSYGRKYYERIIFSSRNMPSLISTMQPVILIFKITNLTDI